MEQHNKYLKQTSKSVTRFLMSRSSSKITVQSSIEVRKFEGLARLRKLVAEVLILCLIYQCARLLKEHPTPDIPLKLDLAKRLAQCLNPQLPHGTHKITLQVYSVLFKNLRLGENWNSSIQVKPEFIQLISDNFLMMGIEMVPMLTGLVTSLLPGFEEQDENLQKSISKLFDGLKQSVGQRFLIGSVWIAMLKNQKVRAAAIKFLNKEMKNMSQISSGEGNDMHHQKIVMGSMKMIELSKQRDCNQFIFDANFSGGDSLAEESQKRLFDTLITAVEMDIYETKVFFPKGAVITSSCLACLEDESVIIRRAILDFIGSYIPLDNDDLLTKDDKLVLVEGTLCLLEKKDISINRRIYKWLFSGDVDNEIKITAENKDNFDLMIQALKNLFKEKKDAEYDAILPIKILTNIFIEHEELTAPILEHLAAPFILYYYDSVMNTSSNEVSYRVQVQNQGSKLIDNLGDYMQLLLGTFRGNFIEESRSKLEAMKILKFLINSFLENESSDNRRKATHLRIALVSVLEQVNNLDMGNLKNLDPESIELLHLSTSSIREQIEALKTITDEGIIVKKETIQDEVFIANLVTFTENITNMFRNFCDEDPAEIARFKQVYRDSVSLMIKSFEYTQGPQPQMRTELPEWLKRICLLLKVDPQILGQISMRYLLRIMQLGKTEQDSIMANSEIPDERDTLTTLDSGLSRMTSIDQRQREKLPIKETEATWMHIRNQLLSEKIQDVLDFCLQKELAEQVWNYFCLSENSKESVTMILKFCESSPNELINYLKTRLRDVDIETADASYRQIATFWRMTQEVNSPEAVKFRANLVFDMLSYLDANNPLHRYSAKGWLISSVSKLETILNSIFETLLASTNWISRPEIYYEEMYDFESIKKSFKYLKDMLIVMGNSVTEYFAKTKISDSVRHLVAKLIEPKLKHAVFPYMDMLCVTCLRYIQGSCDPSFEAKFVIENLSVKSVACEFLEILVSRIQEREMMQQICCYLMSPLTKVLKLSVENEESGILIQLIALLNVVLFKSNLHMEVKGDKTENRETYIKFLQTPIFMTTVSLGLKSKVLYILTEFRNFANNTLVVLSECLRHPNLTQLVRQLLQVYFDLISKRGVDSNLAASIVNTNNDATDSARLMVLIDGLDFALKTFIGGENMRNKDEMDGSESSSGMFGFFLGRGNNKEEEKFFKKHEDVGKAILNDLSQMLDAFIACWYPSKKFKDCVKLTNRGCHKLDINQLKGYVIDSYKDKIKEIDFKIVKILRPFGARFMANLGSELLNYWTQAFGNRQRLDQEITEKLSTVIEIVSETQIHPIELLNALTKSSQLKDIERANNGIRKKAMKGAKFELNIISARREAKILYFVYNYLGYMKLDYSEKQDVRRGKYLQLWQATSSFLNCFSESLSLNTCFWILEIFILLSEKFNFSDLMGEVYSDYQKVLQGSLEYISAFAAGKINLTFDSFLEPGAEVTPICPSIFEIDQRYPNRKVLSDSKYKVVNEILRDEFTYSNEVYRKYRFHCLNILANVVKSHLFTQGENTKIEKLNERVFCVTSHLYLVLYDRMTENLPLVECVSEVFHNLICITPNKNTINELKKDILDIFNLDNFFRCTQITLGYWSRIIDNIIDHGKEDLLNQNLKDINFSSVFKSKTTENKTRIKSFERVCFIIYSGDVDKYSNKKKIKALLEKIRVVLKGDDTHPSLLILIMFCIRILILRLSSLILNELFKNIWPILLTLLITIFDNTRLQSDLNIQSNIHVVLAALKLLELLSVCQIEEFNVYEWIFVFDYFGVQIDTNPNHKQIQDRNDQRLISPLKFKPFLSNCIPEGLQVEYLSDHYNRDVFKQKSSKKEKRRILITQNNLETEFELQAKAQELLNYLILLNQSRVYVDTSDIESLIQNDFIGMNSMF